MAELSAKSGSSYDLETFRDRVHQLYVKEKRSLNDVIDILRDEGCHASRNMYLRKIQLWGFGKNRKRGDIFQRKDELRKTSASVAGSTVQKPTRNRNLKYLSRTVHYVTGEQVVELSRLIIKQPDELESMQQVFAWSYDVQRWMISTELIKEHSKHSKQPYVHADSSTFRESFMAGIEMIKKGQPQAAGALFEIGFRTVETLIRNPFHLFFETTMVLCHNMVFYGLDELMRMFLRYLHQISSHLLGAHHALSRIFKNFYGVPSFHTLGTLSLQVLTVLQDATVSVVGRNHPNNISIRMSIITRKRLANVSFSEMCSDHESLIEDCAAFAERAVSIARRNYAFYLYEQNQFDRAKVVMRVGGAALFREPPPDRDLASAAAQCCYEWAEIIMLEPEHEDPEVNYKRFLESEQILKATVEKSILILGPQNIQTIKACQNLADLYSKHGHIIEESAQRQFILDQLAEFQLG